MRKTITTLVVGFTFAGLTIQADPALAAAPPASLPEARVIIAANQPANDLGFSSEACKLIQDTVYDWNLGTLPTPQCVIASSQNSAEIKSARDAKAASVYISIFANPDKSHTVTIENWDSRDPADFRKLSWKIDSSADWQYQTRRLLSRFSDFDAEKRRFQKFLLVNGLTEASRVGRDQRGFFDRQTGSQLSFDAAYALFRDENPKQKNYLQAALEIGAVLGASTINYYVAPEGNFPDWEYDLRSSIRDRLNSKAVRLDDNKFSTNVGHYYAGATYYTIARSNGLGKMESLLYTFAASSSWEYIAEFREVVSINDQINTTLGGFIIGETLHEMGRLFASGSNTLPSRMLQAVFGSPNHFNSWLAKNTSGNRIDISETGFQPDVWGKAGIYFTADTNAGQFGRTGAQSSTVGFDAQVIDIPLFEEPGQVRSLLTDTVFSSLLAQHGTNSQSMETFKLFMKTTLAAYYEKNLGRDRDGNLNGYNLFVGPSMALDIDRTESIQNSDHAIAPDFHGIVHVLGGTLDLTAYSQGYRIRCVMDVYGDFAMMRSYAFEQYIKAHDVSRTQNVLREHDYYYGSGYTANLSVILNKDRYEAGAAVSSTQTNMIQSRNRFASETDHVPANDRRVKAEAWVAYQLSDSVKIKFGVEKNLRSGSVGDTNLTGSDVRKTGTLIYTLK